MKQRVIKLSLTNPSTNNKAVDDLLDYIEWIEWKSQELAAELAAEGWDYAVKVFESAFYKGPKDFKRLDIEERGEGKYAIVAEGETYILLEFGAGITYYGEGHPQAEEFGFGPGTYPGQTHALTGKGWYLPKAKGGEHTYGNPPNRAMYDAAKEMRDNLLRIARKVFNS